MRVATATKPADIPGYPFKQELFAREVTYFIAHKDGEPVGQTALMKKGDRWWFDYLFVREDMRRTGVVRALREEVLSFAAELTDYVWMNCEGMKPEDLKRTGEKYGLKVDVLNSGMIRRKPFTVIRICITALRKQRTA